jgi:hypothetical protein
MKILLISIENKSNLVKKFLRFYNIIFRVCPDN